MKIAVIAPSFVPSSAANSIQVMKVCQALVQAGAEVELWVPLEAGQQSDVDWHQLKSFYGIETEFPIHWVKENLRFRRYDFAWKAVSSAAGWGADVIYTWMVQAAILSHWHNILPVLELHMLPTGKLGPFLLRSFSCGRKEKLVLPITNALRQRLANDFGVVFEERQTLIAPMGSEPERYQNSGSPAESRQQLRLEERLTAVYTGHLYAGRGMDMLLALARAYPKVAFLWIGGREPELTQWREKVASEGVNNITLTGFVDNELLPLYQSAGDILLMPYQRNVGVSGVGDTADVCSPMKLFDYLSAGRAILSSDLPVFHEVLNQTNAVFCSPEDEAEWIQAFGILINDEKLRIDISQQAKMDAQRYSWLVRAENTVEKLTDLL